MTIRREWLDWNQPCLLQAAAWLIQRSADSQPSGDWRESHAPQTGPASNPKSKIQNPKSRAVRACDLPQIICVLPSQRGGRLLLAQLMRQCAAADRSLVPPRILTPGMLLEELTRDQPVASTTETVLAWMKALRESDAQSIEPLLPHAPPKDDALTWHELASTIARLHADLAGAMVSFARVADQAERMEMFAEGERWRALEQAHVRYGLALAACGLRDPHQARQEAIEQRRQHGWPDPQAQLVLIGVTELNAMQRTLIACAGARVTALVHAPESLAQRFDDCGCVISDQWQDAPIDIDDAQIHIADHADDQAQAALRAVAELKGRYAASQITIGMGDESMIAVMQRGGEWAGLNLRAAAGAPLGHSAPLRFLQAAADWISEPRFANFAALLRHPDVEQWILDSAAEQPIDSINPKSKIQNPKSAVADWLSLLDRYFADHLHERMSGVWLGKASRRERLGAVYEAVGRLLAPLMQAVTISAPPAGRSQAPAPRPLGDWGTAILQVLASLYGGGGETPKRRNAETPKEIDAPHPEEGSLGSASTADQSIAVAANQNSNIQNPKSSATDCTDPALHAAVVPACLAVRDVLAQFAAAPAGLQPRTDAAGALRLLLLHAGGQSIIPEDSRAEHIELLGWLELHLDTAPALIISGFNEGQIPRTVPGGPFLPDSLRSALGGGLPDNAQRYARDAYLVQAIHHSRESFAIVAGRRDQNGDPLSPSRLLLACDDETLVRRIRRMCDEPADRVKLPPIGVAARQGKALPSIARSQFCVPALPESLQLPQVMRVTEFSRYLACPYRYALERLLQLESFDDHAVEMDARMFGSLAHEVLCEFGSDALMAQCADAEEIEKFLSAELTKQAARRFGRFPMPAVRVQVERLQQRLRSFAKFQAQRCTEGWRIRHCEQAFKGEVALDVPGQDPMPLHGKIDRIDFNERTGQWLIIDYKTGEAGESPHKKHHGRERLADAGELEWRDLQLPLYHYLATRSQLGINGRIDLAYICLPKQTDGASLQVAQWTQAHLDSAFDAARDIVRNIRAGRFDMNPEFASPFDSFARICQTTVFGKVDEGEDEEEEQGGGEA